MGNFEKSEKEGEGHFHTRNASLGNLFSKAFGDSLVLFELEKQSG